MTQPETTNVQLELGESCKQACKLDWNKQPKAQT